MPGPEKLKSVCFKCKVNRWIVDYKEACLSRISSTSVCLFCEQAALIDEQKMEIERLRTKEQERDDRIRKLEEYISKIEKLIPKPSNALDVKVVDRKVEELRKVITENRDEIVESGKQVVEIREEIASFKDNANFQVVKGRKLSKVNDRDKGITIANRFAVLEDEGDVTEVEAYVIGDSIVREQKNHFALKSKKRRKVQSYPGCKAKKVVDEVNRLEVQNKNTCIIANVGSNDLYLKRNEVGYTEPLVADLKRVVDTVADKTNRGILVGILPRAYASYYAMSKAIGINERLSKYCKQKKVDFIDVWKIFVGKWHYFRKDGIHLNEAGHRKLGEILCREYDRMKNEISLSHRTPELPTNQAQVSLEENTFEGFPKENQ